MKIDRRTVYFDTVERLVIFREAKKKRGGQINDQRTISHNKVSDVTNQFTNTP